MGICGSTATVPSVPSPPQPAPQRLASVPIPSPQTSPEIALAPSFQAVTRTRSRAGSTTHRMSSHDSTPRSRTKSEPRLPQSSMSSSSQNHRTRAKSPRSPKSLSPAITATVPSEPLPPQPAPQGSSAPSFQAVTRTRNRAGSTTQRSRMSSHDSNAWSRTKREVRPPQSSISSSPQNHRKSLRSPKSLSPAIQRSIESGRRSRYWCNLWSNLKFADKPLRDCVNVIHIDIVKIWDLHDRNGYLSSNQFKINMSHVVKDLAVPAGGASILEWNAPEDNFADWVYDAYRGSQEIVRCLMGYIINLTVILDGISRTTARNTMENAAQEVMGDHIRSCRRNNIHRDISRFVAETFPNRFSIYQDSVLEEIIGLIKRYCAPS